MWFSFQHNYTWLSQIVPKKFTSWYMRNQMLTKLVTTDLSCLEQGSVTSYLPSHYITVTQFQYTLILFIAQRFASNFKQGLIYVIFFFIFFFLAMLTYIYLDVDDISMPQQRLKLQMSLNYANILNKILFLMCCWWPC